MKEKLKSKISAGKVAVGTCLLTALSSVPVFAADGTSTDTITTAISSGIDETKSTFLTILGVVVAGAMAFFAIKFAVHQGIGFFSKLAKK